MKTVTVSASSSYEVKIGSGLLPFLGHELSGVCSASKICIVSDSHVWPLWGKAAVTSKNGSVYLELLNFLAENHMTRSDCLVALGGGVVGDMTGFAAATFLRGIAYVQVPTTLLAMVDSSVGGKTAIDLDAGKNLAGAFYQPKLVLCDTDTLNTLTEDIFRDGCAEVIKYGVLYDRELFDRLAERGLSFDRESVIARCVELKRNVVAEDEFDTGNRMKLNLGHTVGHGIESSSHFTVSHGKAVSIGMAIVSRAGCALGICGEDTRDAVIAVLERFGLPTDTDCFPETIYTSALSDKKRSGGTVNLIVPEKIGFCRIQKTPVSQLLSFIEAGM